VFTNLFSLVSQNMVYFIYIYIYIYIYEESTYIYNKTQIYKKQLRTAFCKLVNVI